MIRIKIGKSARLFISILVTQVLGNVVFQKISYDHARSIATRGESVSTYPRRPKALSNAVDVVHRLRDPTDQVPNAWHLRDLHTFSSVMSLEL